MKIALIGATGNVGSAVLDELLSRGHEVIALQRDPSKVAARENLRVVQADVSDAANVEAAVQGTDMVVSAFNAGWTNPNLYNDFMKGARAITQGTKKAGVPRLLVVGGAGSLYDDQGNQIVDSPQFPPQIFPGANAARHTLDELKQETVLNWTFLSPPVGYTGSEQGERTGRYRLGGQHPLSTNDGPGQISSADLAVAIVDEVERDAHSRRQFTVAY